MARQQTLLDDAPEEHSPRTLREIEEWIESAPEEWRDPLRWLIANGLNKRDALIAAWWSLGKDGRKAGKLDTLQKLATWLGISRARLATLENRRHGEPPRDLRTWGQQARVRKLNEFGPDVDRALTAQLMGGEASAAHFQLYYKITGVVVDESKLHLVGADDGPVSITRADDLSDDELANIAAGRGIAARGGK